MRYLMCGIGLVGGVILITASGCMNFMFWLTQGRSAIEADFLAAVRRLRHLQIDPAFLHRLGIGERSHRGTQ
jgi:hypothetical protein